MTEIQKRLLKLMDEIDEACDKENLTYILTHQTAAYAQKNGKFINSMYGFQILMPLPDIYRLQDVLKQTDVGKRRSFESWEDNPALHQMTFRYVDEDSLLYDGEAGEYHTKPGIAITIFAVKLTRPSHDIIGEERYLQKYNSGMKRMFWVELAAEKRMKKMFGEKTAQSLFRIEDLEKYEENTAGIAKGGFQALLKGTGKLSQYVVQSELAGDLQLQAGAEEAVKAAGKWKNVGYWFMRTDGKLAGLSKNLFSDVQVIRFENRKYPVAGNLDIYLEKILGDDWKEEAYGAVPISNFIRVIGDASMPYKEYLAVISENHAGQSLKKDTRLRAEFKLWVRQVYEPAAEESSHTYARIRRSIDRINVWYHLKPERENLQAAYAAKNVEKLKELLHEYLAKTEKYRKKGIGFYIDDELYEYAKLVWDTEKKKSYAKKVYKLVPDFYKKETVDGYFAQRK